MHISIKKLATAFAGITFALSCACSAWGADPVTIQDASGNDISVYEVYSGFYQNGTTYNNSTDFYITSKAGLLFFRDIVNGETAASYAYFTATGVTGTYPTTPNGIKSFHSNNMFSGKTVHLCEDIDLAGEQWVTIGFNRAERTITDSDTSASASVSKCTFYGLFDAGIYDGEGNLTGTHVISNLDTSWQYVPEAATLQSKYQLTGLFGQLSGGTSEGVKNLTVSNATVVGRADVGVIAGRSYQGGAKIENCHVIGNVNVSGTGSYVGGLVGECRGSIVDSSVAPDAGSSISGLAYVGGLAGSVYQYNTTASVEVSGCAVSNTAVSASYSGTAGVGALVGVTNPSGTYNGNVVITGNDANDVSVTAPNASASSGSVGTLVGYALDDDGAYAIVADNTVSGTTTATAGGDAVTTKMGAANDNIAVGANVTFDESGKVTGGIFEVINEEVIAEGYITDDNPDSETSASYPLIIGGPYEAVLYDGNNTLIQGYATLQEAFAAANAIEGSDGVTIMILQASVSSDSATITRNLLIDTELAGGATINFNGNSFTAQSGAIVTFSDDVAATGNVDLKVVGGSPVVENAKLVLNNAVLAGGMTVDVNGGEIVINPTARVTLNGSENPIFLAVGNITVNGDLNEGAAQTVTLADVTGAQQLSGSGGYFQGYFGKNIVTLNNTFVSTIWVDYSGYTDYSSYTQYGPAYAGYATDNRFILTNSVLYITNVENANKGFNLGGFNGVLSLTGSRLIASGAPVVVNSGDVANLDVASSITAKTFTNNGVVNIDATGITQATKVIDYTGSGTMALADYGTVNVTGGTAYVDGNDLWITMPPVAEAYDAEGGTLIGQFATVNEAIAAAGATYVKLLDDVTLTAPLTMTNSSSYTLDFDGKTIYYNTTATTLINGSSNIIFKNGKLDISGCAISSSTYQGLLIFKFNPDGNILTFDKMELYGKNCRTYGIFSFANSTNGSTVNFINGSRIAIENESNLDYSDIFKGLGSTYPYVINITDSTVSCTNVTRFSLYGTVNVKDSTVTFTGGENAFRQGAFTFDNSTVTVSGAKAGEGKGLVPRFSDTIVTNGSALTFIGSNIGKDVLFEYANNIVIYDTSTVTAASVSGAAADRAIVAPANYVLVTTDNGGASVTYSVTPAVAQIGDVKYATFSNAIAAAEAYYETNGSYPTINVLDATAELTNPEWKIDNGYLVRKVYVAQIVSANDTTNKYETVEAALTAAQASGATIEILANSIETPDHALEVLMGGDIVLTAAAPVRVEIAPTAKTSSVDNDGMAYIRSASAEARCTFTVGENVTLAFPATAAGAGAMYIGYSSTTPADMVVNGRLETYIPYVGSLSTLTVNPSGAIKSISEDLIVRWGATVDIIGTGAEWSDANPQAEFGYVELQGGTTTLKDTYAKGGAWVHAYNRNADKVDQYGETKLVLDNSVLATSKINNQAVIELDVDSQIVTPVVQNTGSIDIDATGITQAAKIIDYTGSGTMALADYGTVNVTGGEAYVDDNDLWVKKLPVAQIGETKYETIAAAVAAASTGDTIQLIADADEDVSLATWKNNAITFDLGGHTLTGQIIAPYGAKTDGIVIRNGNIVGRDSSGFYCLQFGYGSGNATLENLSVTQVSQNYRSYAVFFQQTSKSVTLRNVTLDGRFYTANSQSTIAIESGVYKNSTGLSSSEISNGGVVAARGGKFYYDPTTPNNIVAQGYVATETNDVNDVQCWVIELGPAFAIVTYADSMVAEFWDLDEAIGALAEGATLTIKPGTYNLANANYTLPKNVTIVGVEENGSRVLIKSKPTFNSANGLTIQNIDFDGGYSWTPPAVTVHGDATFKNCTIIGENAVYYSTVNGTLTFDNCTLTADTYALNVGEGTGDVIVKDCTISGWTSFGNTGKTVITGTTFEEGDYNYVRFYQDAVIDDCTFNTNMAININTTGKSLIVSDSAFEDGSSIASVIGEGENDDPVANNYVAVGTNVQLDENGDIVGGIFETIDDELIAAGYLSVDNLESATAERYPLTVGGPFVAVIVDDNGNFIRGYTTLADAIFQAGVTETKTNIKLLDDVTDEVTDLGDSDAAAYIGPDTEIVLDLNGHDIVNATTGDTSKKHYAIYNDGILTIKDSMDDGTTGGHVYTKNVARQGNDAILNSGNGVLTITGGWFGDADSDKTNANLFTRGACLRNSGEVTLEGGHFTNIDNFSIDSSSFAYAIINLDGDVVVNDGTDIYGEMNGIFGAVGGNVIVNGGSFSLGRADAVMYDGNPSYVHYFVYADGGNVTVNGGTWTKIPMPNNGAMVGSDLYGNPTITGGSWTLEFANFASAVVSGGIFNKSVPAANCDPDYSPAANSDPATSAAYPFTVAANGVAKIVKNGTTTYYASLTQAYDASVAGDTIELLADDHSLADGSELFINHSVTITGAVDGNGKPKYTIYGKNDSNDYNDIFIRAGASDTVTISNVNVAQFGNQASLVMDVAPIYVGGGNAAKVVLDNVHVSEFLRIGVMMSGSGEFEVKNCYIDGTRERSDTCSYGIEVHRGAHGVIADTTIENVSSTSEGWGAACVTINGQGAVSITNCTFVGGVSCDGIGTSENATEGACTSVVTIEDSTIDADCAMGMNVDGAQFVVKSGTYSGYLGLKDGSANAAPYSISGGMFEYEVPEEFCAAGYVPTANTDAATKDAYPYTVRIGYAKDDEVVVVGDNDYPLTQTEADYLNALLDKGEGYSKDAITNALANISVSDFQEAALLNIDITKTYAKPIFKITAIKRNRTDGTVSVTVTLTRENKVAQPIRGTLILETSSDCVNWDGCQDVQLYDEHFSESDTAVITMPIAKNARIFKAKVVDPAEITSGTGE